MEDDTEVTLNAVQRRVLVHGWSTGHVAWGMTLRTISAQPPTPIACGHVKLPCHKQLLCLSISMCSGELMLLSFIRWISPASAQALTQHTRTRIVYIGKWGYSM